jgi:hypothetical protein
MMTITCIDFFIDQVISSESYVMKDWWSNAVLIYVERPWSKENYNMYWPTDNLLEYANAFGDSICQYLSFSMQYYDLKYSLLLFTEFYWRMFIRRYNLYLYSHLSLVMCLVCATPVGRQVGYICI